MSIAIRFLQRRNLGNYEHSELEITDSVENKSSLNSAINSTMNTVKDALYQKGSFAPGSVFSDLGSDVVVPASTNPPAGTKVTKVTKKEEPKVETEKKVDAPVNQEPKTAETPVLEEKPQTEGKEEAKKEEKTTVKKETKTVTKASKVTAYDRNLDAHKNNLGAFLDTKFPGWRKPENLKKAGAASRELQGAEFLDNEGNIVESFKESFSKHMVGLV